jgi:UDPglucose 6-dehydrogenase
LFGYGVVGKLTAMAFSVDYCFDWGFTDYKPIGDYHVSIIKRCDQIFICVPTPLGRNKKYDLSNIEGVFKLLRSYEIKPLVIIRSTVSAGTAKRLGEKYGLNIISYPEFLSEKTAVFDMAHPWFCVLGGREETLDNFINEYGYFEGKSIIRTDNTTAELFKETLNAIFGTLVVFGNQIFDVAQKVNADYDVIRWGIGLIPWPAQTHLDVMHGGYRGYGGKCLPKDIQALANQFNVPLLKLIHKLNAKYFQRSYSGLQSARHHRKVSVKRYKPGV